VAPDLETAGQAQRCQRAAEQVQCFTVPLRPVEVLTKDGPQQRKPSLGRPRLRDDALLVGESNGLMPGGREHADIGPRVNQNRGFGQQPRRVLAGDAVEIVDDDPTRVDRFVAELSDDRRFEVDDRTRCEERSDLSQVGCWTALWMRM
jgi:hypothetical protein